MSNLIAVKDHILYEDEFIIVINKPAGLMVEPDRNNHPNLLHQVRKYLDESQLPGAERYLQHIHRLDRPVSGIVLFAKQRSVLHLLSNQFAERKVKKYYLAITQHAPEETSGTLEHWHRKEKKKAVLYAAEVPFSEKALLTYRVSALGVQRFCWHIQLLTGKYHQIRAQLASVGCPILGDTRYGSKVLFDGEGIALQACKLQFLHPITNKELCITVPAKICEPLKGMQNKITVD